MMMVFIFPKFRKRQIVRYVSIHSLQSHKEVVTERACLVFTCNMLQMYCPFECYLEDAPNDQTYRSY